MTEDRILKVAINVPLARHFDYLPPAGRRTVPPGCRVLVPFGRQRVVGLVMGERETSELPRSKLRRAENVLDDDPLVPDEGLWLIRFTSDYYHHPIGEVAAAALPVILRKGDDLYPTRTVVAATDDGRAADVEALAKRAPKQAELLEALVDAGHGGLSVEALSESLPAWRRIAKSLESRGYIRRLETKESGASVAHAVTPEDGPSLNDAQRAAVAAIQEAEGFDAFLLDGVTGSGKTEVYLHLIRDVVAAGGQALVLVPEIGLTPQLVARFRERLGIEPALLHSGLGDTERLAAWRDARSGAARLVVGTRSAVFVPLPNGELIVVDEEHDHSFKQQEGLRYSARDLAIARANRAGIPIVLGTATPTLEMLKHCSDGNYRHLSLPHRAGGAEPPDVHVVDISRELVDDGLSHMLTKAIDRHLSNGCQVMLFLNRRGFAPTLICGACGHVVECRQCDSRMTVHARERRLRCHHCGESRPLDDACGECGNAVRTLGAGTERLEDALKDRFPGRTVVRIDSDTTQRKGSIDEALFAATGGRAEILVGTQMLSKGHHFPKLTLVGIVNADQGLFGSDFRSDERLAQSIVQVSGRAGRERQRGEVLIQTAFPDHPFWQRLIAAGYAGVADDVLAEREETRWPPFSRLALIRAGARRRDDAHALLVAAKRAVAGENASGLRVLGPVDAVMARKAGRYRAQLLLQSQDRQALHRALRRVRPALEQSPLVRRVRWSIDVDPIELF